MFNKQKKRAQAIDYDAVVDVILKRCRQLNIDEAQLLAHLPTASLRDAVVDLESVFIIGQLLNFELDSIFAYDLPMEHDKLDVVKEKLKPLLTDEDMKDVYEQLIHCAGRMGEKRFYKILGDVVEDADILLEMNRV